MSQTKDKSTIEQVNGELNIQMVYLGHAIQAMQPGEAYWCATQAMIRLREAMMWLDQATVEQNVQ